MTLTLLLGPMTGLAVFFATPQTLGGQGPAPWVGTWRLDPAESTQGSGASQYLRTTLRIEPSEGGLKVVYDLVGTRGGRTHLEWLGALDGRDYPVQGLDYVLTNAYSRTDDGAYEILVKLDGLEVARTRVEVSPDGQVLTAVTTERNATGEMLTSTAVYQRQR